MTRSHEAVGEEAGRGKADSEEPARRPTTSPLRLEGNTSRAAAAIERSRSRHLLAVDVSRPVQLLVGSESIIGRVFRHSFQIVNYSATRKLPLKR